MKFLVDESTGIIVSEKLTQMGFDSISVIACMRGADDEEIMKRAVAEKHILITNDKDFGRLAGFYKPQGLILLRLKDERTENKIKIVSFVVATYGEAIVGNFLVVSERKIRIKSLETK